MSNPYRSPAGVPRGECGHVGTMLPGARATLVGRGLLFRRLVIEAPVEMTLEFNGRSLTDKILVNDHLVARKTSWWRIAPRLAFTLRAGDQLVTGLVEIRVWPWLTLRGFRVSIAERVVYAEGRLASRTARGDEVNTEEGMSNADSALGVR